MLAGHSFGGLYVRSFAAQFPDEVAGMVLVDSTAAAHPTSATPVRTSDDPLRRGSALLSAVGRFGVARLVNLTSYASLPPAVQDEARAGIGTAESLRSYFDEILDGGTATAQAGSLVDLADKPLIVLTAGQEHDDAWMAAQDATVALSTNSRHRVVEQATHSSLLLEQDDAAETSRAIRDVVDAVQTSRVLAQ